MSKGLLSIRLVTKKAAVKNQLEGIIRSMSGFTIKDSGENAPTDLMIYELGKEPTGDLRFVENLMSSGEATQVFITSETADPDLLIRAMRTGAKEFFSQPLKEEDVVQALERFRSNGKRVIRPAEPGRMGRVISVVGSKGGVGTTTIAVNLAASLASLKKGVSVAAVDLNPVLGDMPVFLSMKPRHNWGEVLKSPDRMDDTLLMNLLARHSSGIHILAAPSLLNGNNPDRPEAVSNLLSLMKINFDYIVVDNGRSLYAASIGAMQAASEVLLVSVLSLSSLTNANRLVKTLPQSGYVPRDKIKVVINRHLKKNDLSPKDAQAALETPIFWSIPNDYKTAMGSVNEGQVLNQFAPKSSLAIAISEMAAALYSGTPDMKKKKFGFLKRH
jgi:pilus assembly protein CpaE